MVKISSPDTIFQCVGSLSVNAAIHRNWINPKKSVNDVSDSLAGYFFTIGAYTWRSLTVVTFKVQTDALLIYKFYKIMEFEYVVLLDYPTWRTIHPAQDKQWQKVKIQPNAQLCILFELSVDELVPFKISGPLYKVITIAPPMLTKVPRTFTKPSILATFTCSILKPITQG